ncbi:MULTISPECIES: PLP-dependent aminotransferase family protein [unclassified Mesorhizobium]|uniref:MocR-like pyridoxine biosynthesis transcription factor PdxR n=1 Tax=unclassified Mesorhizobium TaxID=325217 RepID=UPI001CCD9A10|nr:MULTISPECIES: PLP-dependent aminotransferase family protein [unclassified Mesorhizobium]MBZ9738181.1 PLP-dependent aminotransferase family protein [Mesorhizobium sp. CO1-1-4]MBZ9803511.1 PLP-dependent aminotransferase family protein [Mesorhizobium sp. ES1-6]
MAEKASRRHEGATHLVDIAIDRASRASIGRQLYFALRDAIVSGRMPAGARLPSTRAAAGLWGVSRGVVVEAYDTLLSESYVVGHHGSGTFVSADVPGRAERTRRTSRSTAKSDISSAARSVIGNPSLDPQPQVPFATGRAEPDDRTRAVLKRIGHRHLEALSDHYRDPQGEERLRREVATYLAAARGVRCEPDRVFITSGSQQAIDLAIRTLIDPRDTIAIEDPSYPPARLAFTAGGAEPIPVPVDRQGINVDLLAKRGENVRAVYVTPSHQYPTGTVLSMARRLALIDWAAAKGAWVLEDDYDSEFRYDDRPLAALQGVDEYDRVIYFGTFSKALLPGFRLGYLVVPAELVPAFRAMRVLIDRFPAPFHQLVVADFLSEGHFSSHLRRLREAYRASRDMLVTLLREQFVDQPGIAIEVPMQGVHLFARLSQGLDDVSIAQAARRSGVTVLPVSPMHLAPVAGHGLLLGFSALHREDAAPGVRRLAQAVLQGRSGQA